MVLALTAVAAGVVLSFVPTKLPTAPMENARVIVAPCSPLMAAQQQWAWPWENNNHAAPLTLTASGMSLHLLPKAANTPPAAVVRSGPADGAAMWFYNETVSVLQLAPAAAAHPQCLMKASMDSNMATGGVPATSAFDSIADCRVGAALFRNGTDGTIRYIWRDAYSLNQRNFSVCLTATWGEPCAPAAFKALPFCNRSLSHDQRTDDLLARATVPEMAALLSNDNANHPWLARLSFNPNNTQEEALHGASARNGGGGAPASPDGPNPAGTGFGTTYPAPLALAATLNRTLWGSVGTGIGMEQRALANQGVAGLYLRSPNLNMARDPRWGRVMETAGEDPTLVSEYGAALSLGMAGNLSGNATTLLAAPAPKHFSAYCGPEDWSGTEQDHRIVERYDFDAVVPDKYLTEYFFPGWRAAIGTGAVRGPMCSYNSVNGVASCSNDFFNNQLLRKEWGMDGFVISDCGELRGLDSVANHGTSAHPYVKQVNGSMSCQAALRGGCDMDCGSTFDAHLDEALANGNVLPSDVARAARRALKPSVELGLLDPPGAHPWSSLGRDDVDTPANRQLALEAAIQSITLLQNRAVAGKPLLPLSRESTIAVIGVPANFTVEMLANYHGWNTVCKDHSPYLALGRAAGAKLVAAAPGAPLIETNDTSMIPAAVAAAKAADVAVLFVGTYPVGNVRSCPSPPGNCVKTTEAESVDRISIGLPGVQSELARAVVQANPRTVLVMMNAGPLAIEEEKLHVPAIVESYFPGEMGGDAIAAVLYGDHAPAGRLPLTIYPANYTTRNMSDYNLTNHEGTTHLHYTGTPLWPFGWGMGYTTFQFELMDKVGVGNGARFTASGIASGTEPIEHVVLVTNTGSVRSAVSVQAFVSSDHADAPVNSRLYDFGKTAVLAPGERTTLRLTLRPRNLALVDDAGDERVAAGEYTIRIGGAGSGATRDADFATSAFTVTGLDVALWQLTAARSRWEQSRLA